MKNYKSCACDARNICLYHYKKLWIKALPIAGVIVALIMIYLA